MKKTLWILVLLMTMTAIGHAQQDIGALEEQWLQLENQEYLQTFNAERAEKKIRISREILAQDNSDWLSYGLASDAFDVFFYMDNYEEDYEFCYQRFLELIQDVTLDDILNREMEPVLKGFACYLYAREQEGLEAISAYAAAADFMKGNALELLPRQQMLLEYLKDPAMPIQLRIYRSDSAPTLYQNEEIARICQNLAECTLRTLPQGQDNGFTEAVCYFGECAAAYLSYAAYYEKNPFAMRESIDFQEEFLKEYERMSEMDPDQASSQSTAELYCLHAHLLYADLTDDDAAFDEAYKRLTAIFLRDYMGLIDNPRWNAAEFYDISRNVEAMAQSK